MLLASNERRARIFLRPPQLQVCELVFVFVFAFSAALTALARETPLRRPETAAQHSAATAKVRKPRAKQLPSLKCDCNLELPAFFEQPPANLRRKALPGKQRAAEQRKAHRESAEKSTAKQSKAKQGALAAARTQNAALHSVHLCLLECGKWCCPLQGVSFNSVPQRRRNREKLAIKH